MQHKFYDVKTKSHVTADVTEKVAYGQKGNERYAFRAKTADASKTEVDAASLSDPREPPE